MTTAEISDITLSMRQAENRKPDKRVLAAIAAVHAAAVALTWWDLRGRTDRQVRGDKQLWRAASGLNTLGAAAYWMFGRRRSAR